MDKIKYIAIGLIMAVCGSVALAQSLPVYRPVQGGTGTGVAPTLGQVLVGTSGGVYAPQNPSTLGFLTGSGVAGNCAQWLAGNVIGDAGFPCGSGSGGSSFSTTSANYWASVTNLFSTTSTAYFLSQNQGNAFSTTSATYFLGQNQGLAFSTTSANYWKSQNVFTGASTTLLADNNTFIGIDSFTATTTHTALQVTPTGNTSASVTVGGAFNLNNTANAGAGAVFFTNHGSGATGRLAVFNCAGANFDQDCVVMQALDVNSNQTVLNIQASSTGKGGLKIETKSTNGGTGGTLDQNASALSIDVEGNGSANSTAAQGLFINSTGSTTGALIQWRQQNVQLGELDSNGQFGLGTTTPGSIFSIGNTGGINFTFATTTFGLNVNGININNGCFSIKGSCLTQNAGTVTSVTGSGGTTGLTLTGGPITTSGTLTLGGTLNVANGGTGQSTLTGGQLLYGNTQGGIGSVATSTLTPLSPLTGSFIQVGSGGSIGCQTASGSQTGCLSSTDWNTFNGKQAIISVNWPITLAGATIGFNGLSTTSPWTNGQVAYVTNGNQVTSVATGTESISSPLTGSSFTIIGAGGSIGCQIASGSQNGCLSSGDWTTFNNKGSGSVTSITLGDSLMNQGTIITTTGSIVGAVGTATTPVIGNLAYWGSVGDSTHGAHLNTVATSSLGVSGPITFSGTIGSQIGGVNGSFGCPTCNTSNASVSSVGSASGITGGPITTTGTLSLVNWIGTSTNDTGGQVPYYATTNGWPAKLSEIATSTIGGDATSLSNSGTTGFQLGGTNNSISINTAHQNNWSVLQTFTQASTSLLSVTTKAYFGGLATTTIDSSGNIVIPSGASLTNTGTSNGCATWASGVLGSTGIACGSGGSQNIFQTLTNGNDAGGLSILDAGTITGTILNATSTTATSTITNALRLGSTGAAKDNELNIDATGRVYPASITTGGAVNCDEGTQGQFPCLELVGNAGSAGTGRMLVVNQQGTADTQDMILASSSCTNCTALDIKGYATGKGLLKIEHFGAATGQSNGSSISLDESTDDAQGLFIKNGTGIPLNIQNSSSATLFKIDLNGNATTTGFLEVNGTGTSTFVGPVTIGSGGIATVNNLLEMTKNTNNYIQSTIQNLSNGNNASTNFVVNNDKSTDSSYYGEFGINSSGYNQAAFSAQNAGDVYLNANDGALVLSTASSTNSLADLRFATGGTASSSIRFDILHNGFLGIGTTTPKFEVDIASSTKPQLSLEDGSASDQWSIRAVGGNLYFATSSPTTFATSTQAAVSIQSSPGNPAVFAVGTSSPFAIGSFVREFGTAPLFVLASTTAQTNAPNYEVDGNGHHIFGGALPTCGTGCSSVVGNDNGGAITTTAGASAVTLNFANTWGITPVCTINDNSTAITGDISAISATSFTASFSVGITGTIYYQCAVYTN